MKCPFCGFADTQVIETRLAEEAATIRRRRQCASCEKRFKTFERAELTMPAVVKRDGRRVEFSSNKLRESINIALRKRPVETQSIDDSIARIEAMLRSLSVREIDSQKIGEAVMGALKNLDKVAFIRYASVYNSVGDVESFKSLVDEAIPEKK